MTQKDLVILEIYNRYSRGEITTEQRDLLFLIQIIIFYLLQGFRVQVNLL